MTQTFKYKTPGAYTVLLKYIFLSKVYSSNSQQLQCNIPKLTLCLLILVRVKMWTLFLFASRRYHTNIFHPIASIQMDRYVVSSPLPSGYQIENSELLTIFSLYFSYYFFRSAHLLSRCYSTFPRKDSLIRWLLVDRLEQTISKWKCFESSWGEIGRTNLTWSEGTDGRFTKVMEWNFGFTLPSLLGFVPTWFHFSMEYSEDEGDASLGWGYEVGSRCVSGWWLGLEIVSTNYDVVRTMCKIS